MSAKKKLKVKVKLPKIGKPRSKASAKAKPKPSKDRMAAAPRDPNTGRPVDPNTGQPIRKAPSGAKQPKSQTVKDNHLRIVYQITNVEEAQGEDGAIVRKTVEAAGPRGATMNFEVNDPVHHDMLQNGNFLSVEMKEVSGHNA